MSTGTVNIMLNGPGMSAGTPGRIVVVGSLNADLTIYCEQLPLPGETVRGTGFAVSPGGKSANQAVAASLLGGVVSLVGAVGGRSQRRHAHGIDGRRWSGHLPRAHVRG